MAKHDPRYSQRIKALEKARAVLAEQRKGGQLVPRKPRFEAAMKSLLRAMRSNPKIKSVTIQSNGSITMEKISTKQFKIGG